MARSPGSSVPRLALMLILGLGIDLTAGQEPDAAGQRPGATGLDRTAAPAPDAERLGPVEEWESNSFALDRSANTMTFDGFRIVGENWNLSADSARAQAAELEFEAGEWHFEGNIRLQLASASLEAESASFEFRGKRLVAAQLSGEPVAFEDTTAIGEEPVRGTAQLLRYDDAAGIFELLGNVTLTVGPYRTTGCDLVYYLGQEEFTTGSTRCEERFRTIIVPQNPERANDE